MNLHELKDIVSIYGDRLWDKADITLWDPDSRTQYNLSFTGSIKPGTDEDYPDGRISFNLSERPISKREQDKINILDQIDAIQRLIDKFNDSRNKLIAKYNDNYFHDREESGGDSHLNLFYLARDKDGSLFAYNNKPYACSEHDAWMNNDLDLDDENQTHFICKDFEFLKDIEWNDREPRAVMFNGSFDEFVETLEKDKDEFSRSHKTCEDQPKEFFYVIRDRIGLWLSAPNEIDGFKLDFITDNPRFMKRVKADDGGTPINSNGQTFRQVLNMLRKQAEMTR